MGQNKKRTRKSSSQRRKPIQGNRATSTNAKKARAKKSSAEESPANQAPLAAHLEKFAKAVADDHSHVEAAKLAGRAPGFASFLYRQPGVKDRIAELLRAAASSCLPRSCCAGATKSSSIPRVASECPPTGKPSAVST